MLDHPREPAPDLRLLAVADRLDEQLTQRAPFELQLPEHVEDLAAQRRSRLVQLLEQRPVDLALPRALGDQVPEVADLRLADAVDATEPLLQPVGVPRQVVVDHQVRALQVDAFAGGVGRDEHLDERVVPERFLGLHAILAAHAAVDHDHRVLAPEQRGDALLEVVQRVALLREDHELLRG